MHQVHKHIEKHTSTQVDRNIIAAIAIVECGPRIRPTTITQPPQLPQTTRFGAQPFQYKATNDIPSLVTPPTNRALPIAVVVIGHCRVAGLGDVHCGQPATNTCKGSNVLGMKRSVNNMSEESNALCSFVVQL